MQPALDGAEVIPWSWLKRLYFLPCLYFGVSLFSFCCSCVFFFFSWLGSQQLLRLTELLKEVKDLSLSQFIQVCIHYIQAHNSIWYVRNKWINKKLHLKKHFKNMGVDLLHFVIFVSITSLTVNSLISFCEILVKFQLNCLIVLASCRINSSFHKGSGLETIIWKYWSTSM